MSRSWVPGADGSGFGLPNLPYGVVEIDGDPRPVVRIGGHVLDLRACQRAGLVPGEWADHHDLTALLAAGRDTWTAARAAVTRLLADDAGTRPPEDALHRLADLPDPHLPFTVGDYVDFYSSIHHATNVGRIFRPDGDPLPPNWRHLPIGYHGRSGTVMVSGSPVMRPSGQRGPAGPAELPPVGPTERLDVELELGFVVGGPPTRPGEPVTTAEADDRIFGVLLLNDWSARDLQLWEGQPLGPFLGKSFATTVSAWVTTIDALGPARVRQPPQDPPVCDYLQVEGDWGLDLDLELVLTPAGADRAETIAVATFADMYWTMPQQLAHATVNGATIRPGDLFGSGTASGPTPGSECCLLELTHGGTRPIRVGDATRTWLQDGDTVTLRARCTDADGQPLLLGDVTGTVVPGRS